MAATAAPALSMKLLIDRRAQRVLFAEASKEVVDFLFSRLSLPVAIVGQHAMVGCVGNLFASVARLRAQAGLPALPVKPSVPPKTFYRCATGSNHNYNISCRNYVTDVYGTACPSCKCAMTTAVNYVWSAGAGGSGPGQVVAQGAARGFGQGIATYTVLDDLTVTPMSAISSINQLLSTCAVRDLGDLQEKHVQLGCSEGMAILKASLQSKTVLTDVFLAGGRA